MLARTRGAEYSPLMKLVTVTLLACLLPVTAARAETGNEVLGLVDQAINSFTDGTFESKLKIYEPNGTARELAFTTYQKVPGKRLVRFSGPGEVKGMGVLVEDKDTMYVYLPGFQKVRRVGTHVKNQTFMGSDFSYEDMSNTRYGAIYDAKLVSQDDKQWEIELAVKPGVEIEYPRVKMWVLKQAHQPSKILFQDASGKTLKTQEFLDYKQDGANHWGPSRLVVTDHRRNNHKSEIVFTGVKLNTGLKDDLFTQRSLLRGQ
jgi:outer membrane lipoprotein-sorting protein